jgi:glycosyltransferase involved in cell wall biosynthesis
LQNLPKVSIITPVKNGKKYIRECIDSILAQDYPRIEHVIVDCCSTDGTVEILQSYTALYPGRVRFISELDRGVGDGWNKGILCATGDILGWLGYDDLYYPGAIRKAVKYFVDKPETMLIYGEGNVLDAYGNIIPFTTEPYNYKRLLNNQFYILLPASFYRKEVFELCGMNDDYGSDYYFFLRVAQKYPFVYANGDMFCQFRLHRDNKSYTTENTIQKTIYQYSRQFGGSPFSVWARLYYATKIKYISQPLRPYLGWVYPLGRAVVRKIAHYEAFKISEETMKENNLK